MKTTITLLFLFLSQTLWLQTARVKGVILNQAYEPVGHVLIKDQNTSTISNENGFYEIVISSLKKTTLVFTHGLYKQATVTLALKNNEDYELNIVLNTTTQQLGEVVISNKNKKNIEGLTTLSPKAIRLLPGANAGVENILKSLPGVNANNELSTQYSVRGGNYDENLVYVNEIEVYRPFLIRSGQQEGLSFTNSDLIQNVDFSSGGFQAKYGDKLSSVLDITYRKPTKFAASLEASFLGANIALDHVSSNQKWGVITGVRYRNNAMLVKSQETQTNFKPSFVDYQSYVTFTPNMKWKFGFLANASKNSYDYIPISRQTNFGTLQNPIALVVHYQGQEKDVYSTLFGAFKMDYKRNNNHTIKFISSVYSTQEKEYFDIEGMYKLGEINTDSNDANFGKVEFTRGIGSQLTHARNNLQAVIFNSEIKGNYKKQENQWDWGLKYTHEKIKDKIHEYEVIDSAGYVIKPTKLLVLNNSLPFLNTATFAPFQFIKAFNTTSVSRLSSYAQWSKRYFFNSALLFINAGLRSQLWWVNDYRQSLHNQGVISPRFQIAVKPHWQSDMLFRLSGGFYHQPPFYRELRDSVGEVRPAVKAQQALHFVLGQDYSFKLWNRPFKLISELYYKHMTSVNPYTLDNVRIRYQANNNATAYATGVDMRLNGEFVPGTESWLSIGYMTTQENIAHQGYIARPTDQRFKFAVLFQDYVPTIPALKMYLNLVYNTGLPSGSPIGTSPYDYQVRLRDYKRADVGFSYVLTETKKAKSVVLKHFKEFAVGFEIFNMFNNQNSITTTWVRDVYSKTHYGIPNYLTSRLFSVKVNVNL